MWITGTDTDDVNKIVSQLQTWFPKRTGFAKDYAAILRFLSNRELFDEIFLEVSQDMEKRYKFNSEVFDSRNKLTSSFHHWFRILDRASEGRVGCNFPMTHEDIVIRKGGKIAIQNVTLTGNAAGLFGGIVSKGYLFKDETGPSHGEYAHTIQWLAIAYAKYYERIKLKNAVVDLYKSSAGPGSAGKVQVQTLDPESDKRITTSSFLVPPWPFLVDCFRSSELHGLPEDFEKNLFVENYRSPSYLTDQMLHRRLRHTFLGQHIQERYKKRNITTGSKGRDTFRKIWLDKQSQKIRALHLAGSTTNALAPNREDLKGLMDDLRTRTLQNEGAVTTSNS